MASKVMQLTKLSKDSPSVQFVSSWVPFHTALPVVAAKAGTMLSSLTHDVSGSHSRAGTKLVHRILAKKVIKPSTIMKIVLSGRYILESIIIVEVFGFHFGQDQTNFAILKHKLAFGRIDTDQAL
jgi:hypothetical protein